MVKGTVKHTATDKYTLKYMYSYSSNQSHVHKRKLNPYTKLCNVLQIEYVWTFWYSVAYPTFSMGHLANEVQYAFARCRCMHEAEVHCVPKKVDP